MFTTPISPLSALRRNESRALTARAPTTAPQASDAADDEHRQREEREIEVDVPGLERSGKVDESLPANPERPGQRECPEPFPADVDAGRAGGGGVLASRTQLAPEAASLVREGDDDHRDGAQRRLEEAGRLGNRGQRQRSGPIFVQLLRMLYVTPRTANVAMLAASPDKRMSGMPTSSAKTPPTAAASTSEAAFPTEWSPSSEKSPG